MMGGLILIVGLILFFSSLADNNLNLALVALTSALILWVIYGLLLDVFDVRIFSWVISLSGFLLAISVFFIYGLEEIPYPSGAIVFHSDGIAKALGLGIASALPLLFGMSNFEKHHNGSQSQKPNVSAQPTKILEDEEYELADIDDLTSGDFEI